MGTQNGHIVPFLESASLKKRKRIKQIYKVFKKGNNNNNKEKKNSCHPEVVIDLPFEGRKPEIQKKGESSKGGKKPSLNRLILALESSTR